MKTQNTARNIAAKAITTGQCSRAEPVFYIKAAKSNAVVIMDKSD